MESYQNDSIHGLISGLLISNFYSPPQNLVCVSQLVRRIFAIALDTLDSDGIRLKGIVTSIFFMPKLDLKRVQCDSDHPGLIQSIHESYLRLLL